MPLRRGGDPVLVKPLDPKNGIQPIGAAARIRVHFFGKRDRRKGESVFFESVFTKKKCK